MSRFSWLAVALAILGFVSGCGGGSSMDAEAPPHDPALDNIDDGGSEYALPEDEDPTNEAAPTQ
ncbi:MAG TPA: hypothetical protein QF564_13905 [Pirellulaceae bacterium]|nr:hypothetical protein [Pirellulaceae bacterium]